MGKFRHVPNLELGRELILTGPMCKILGRNYLGLCFCASAFHFEDMTLITRYLTTSLSRHAEIYDSPPIREGEKALIRLLHTLPSVPPSWTFSMSD